VDRVGPICSCGKRGCLESIAGKPAILSQAQRILVNNQDAILAGIVGDNPANLTLEVICQAANAGSQIVQELIDNAIEHLAIGIQTLATLVDIQVVIFGGDLPQMDKLFFEKLQKAVDRLQKSEESIMILPSQLQSNAFLRGIGMLTLQRIISE
ncbi:MAG: ROK family protein, partial [Chloroflexota bacterium]